MDCCASLAMTGRVGVSVLGLYAGFGFSGLWLRASLVMTGVSRVFGKENFVNFSKSHKGMKKS
ncbi:MAG: hypothetical protein FWD01_01850 [Defluviitaleaceae bacterium]|nr:hypothetical protein [Defluviitaleaceae bacterium]